MRNTQINLDHNLIRPHLFWFTEFKPVLFITFINIIVMKLNNNTQSRPLRDPLAINQLINTLK